MNIITLKSKYVTPAPSIDLVKKQREIDYM